MTQTRIDAWDDEKDKLLLDTVLNHIRTGSTQLKAFEEVGEKLSKTAAACGFRWNSYVRKNHKEEIEQAKKDKTKQNKKNDNKSQAPVEETPAPAAEQTQTEPSKGKPSRRLSVLVNIKSQTEQLLELVGQLEEDLDNEKNNNEDLETQYKELKEKYDAMVAAMTQFTK